MKKSLISARKSGFFDFWSFFIRDNDSNGLERIIGEDCSVGKPIEQQKDMRVASSHVLFRMFYGLNCCHMVCTANHMKQFATEPKKTPGKSSFPAQSIGRIRRIERVF
jgi:hypothetical protein